MALSLKSLHAARIQQSGTMTLCSRATLPQPPRVTGPGANLRECSVSQPGNASLCTECGGSLAELTVPLTAESRRVGSVVPIRAGQQGQPEESTDEQYCFVCRIRGDVCK